MKPRYTLIWSKSYKEWICIDLSKKPIDLTARDYFLIGSTTDGIFYRYLTN